MIARICLAAALLTLFVSSPSLAEQVTTANGQVAHSRIAPVVMHRVVPPYRGVHVYHGRRR